MTRVICIAVAAIICLPSILKAADPDSQPSPSAKKDLEQLASDFRDILTKYEKEKEKSFDATENKLLAEQNRLEKAGKHKEAGDVGVLLEELRKLEGKGRAIKQDLADEADAIGRLAKGERPRPLDLLEEPQVAKGWMPLDPRKGVMAVMLFNQRPLMRGPEMEQAAWVQKNAGIVVPKNELGHFLVPVQPGHTFHAVCRVKAKKPTGLTVNTRGNWGTLNVQAILNTPGGAQQAVMGGVQQVPKGESHIWVSVEVAANKQKDLQQRPDECWFKLDLVASDPEQVEIFIP